ncbi:NADH-FMN oxidoreductase RutF, flavin reductase (DIM6/NTAB) family [Natronorubrum sediminis]|uniref:NADH-FMN oxidoreductase RutF, flavin reductase (DIM6/NTAB) family n=1 Tax=Natronorubrum sediminis TaxID=640943 RepID=A0A1H6G2B7_9EURY|nr:flavin reductase family protein [Natronorubrum sediminis]SEH17217.1 NADH-FMN oxidoreductase RutF, flavin reductase (DIM6/NTAB) family [Natronorubrum sediminis]
MQIDPRDDTHSMYRTLTGLVVPRPIGWISTRSSAGVDNLAPYSFFNAVSVDPPILMFSPIDRPDGLTDTTLNVRETEEFVVNLVTNEFADAMNQTSAELPSSESEFDDADLEREAAAVVEPPRVAGVAAAFECELHDVLDVGSSSLVLGEVVSVYVRDDVTTNGKVDTSKLDIVGRLSGGSYDRIDNRFEMERPD